MQAQIKWYHKPTAVVVALLCIGPLALPLVWVTPAFRKRYKIAITIAVAAISIWLAKFSLDLYKRLLNDLQELQKIIGS